MKYRTTPERFPYFGVGVIVLSVAMGFAATPLLGAEKPSDEKGGSFALRHAETYLKLTVNAYRTAHDANVRFPGTFPASRIEELKGDVDVAKQMVKAARESDGEYSFQRYLRLAKAAAAAADTEFKQAELLNSKTSGVSPRELVRLRLRAELARINVEEGLSLRDASSKKQNVWKLRLLYDDVLRLNEQVR